MINTPIRCHIQLKVQEDNLKKKINTVATLRRQSSNDKFNHQTEGLTHLMTTAQALSIIQFQEQISHQNLGGFFRVLINLTELWTKHPKENHLKGARIYKSLRDQIITFIAFNSLTVFKTPMFSLIRK